MKVIFWRRVVDLIATVGPSTKEKGVLKEIISSGVNVLRLNFSHGSREEFDEVINEAREIKKDIHIMQDLCGSKIRVSSLLPYIYKVYDGEEILFCSENSYNPQDYKVSKSRKKVILINIELDRLQDDDIEEITMKDNSMRFKVQGNYTYGKKAIAMKGGIIRSGKGCNIKGFRRENNRLSTKDKRDIEWGIDREVDIICQSFVESQKDILEIFDYIASLGKVKKIPKFWGKIESPRGFDNLSEITAVVEGILIGRGDLLPESDISLIPEYEEYGIRVAKKHNCKVYIGTHILNSMKGGRSPEVSEVESIYRFVKDGIDGFLLAGETSVGRAPIRTVKFMKELIDMYSVLGEGNGEGEKQ